MPVFLYTDLLLWLLVAVLVVFGIVALRREHLRRAWHGVFASPGGASAGVVLAVYAAIGLLDSLHFRPRIADAVNGEARYGGEVLSVLDVLVGPLRTAVEKSYSAPLATRLYTRETVERPDGSRIREYPRLEWGGRHLESGDDEARWSDIGERAMDGANIASFAWTAIAGVVIWRRARRAGVSLWQGFQRFMYDPDDAAARAALYTLCTLMVLAGMAWTLAGHYHVLGTDKVGQDVLYQALKGVRTGLLIGTLTTLVMLPFALALGLMAGYFGRRTDDVIQYLYTTLNSIPGVLLIAAAVLMLQAYMNLHADEFRSLDERADLRLLFLCLILGITSWTGLCRLLRGEALKLREIDYVQSALSLGASHAAVLRRHLLPNVMHIVLITVVLDFSGLVLAEAVLSYVNIGVDPTTSSWGNMINGARLEMAREPVVWWSLAAAFGFMFVLVLAANLFADAVRDAFDPTVAK